MCKTVASTFLGEKVVKNKLFLFSGLAVLALVMACTGADPTATSAPTSAPTATAVPLGQPPPKVEFNLFPVEATNPVGADHTITATVKVGGNPVAGVTVTFTIISGPNAVQTFTATTDANGNASFTYMGTSAGVDTIEAKAAVAGAVYTSKKSAEGVGDQATGRGFCIPGQIRLRLYSGGSPWGGQ